MKFDRSKPNPATVPGFLSPRLPQIAPSKGRNWGAFNCRRNPVFLQANSLKPFINNELLMSTTPIFYRSQSGGKGVGYDAEIMPAVAEVYLKSRKFPYPNAHFSGHFFFS